jgi:hypothetical protein
MRKMNGFIKRKVKSDIFPEPAKGVYVKWLTATEVNSKYARYGITFAFLRYNRSAKFRGRVNVTSDDIIPVQRKGLAGNMYREDLIVAYIKTNNLNVIKFETIENKSKDTKDSKDNKDTKVNSGQKP